MTIAYEVGDGLYLNLTNRCSCDCLFCLRGNQETVGEGNGSLWLAREPTWGEIADALAARDLSRYGEIVFCGFGEPTERLDVLLRAARVVKARATGKSVRVNTNGHASLLAGRDVTPELRGLVDVLSISLNYPTASAYVENCRPQFGEAAWEGLMDFAHQAKTYVPEVILTVVDVISPEDIESCRRIAERLGVKFRVRTFIS